MSMIPADSLLQYSTYGSGKAIIEILNIGFEPLLTEREYSIYKEIADLKTRIHKLEKIISFCNSKLLYLDAEEEYYFWLLERFERVKNQKSFYEEKHVYKSNLFRSLLKKHTKITRKLFDNREFGNEEQFRSITIFESDLTRCFGCEDMEYSEDIISVVTYYNEIFQSIFHHGFYYNDKHYVFFTAGAGQIRNKKSTFVSENKLNEHLNRLFCGLTKEMINGQGGMNTNKYLAYTSLCQTNSQVWKDFNIDRAIVVEDIEYEIPNQTFRYIYTESPEDKQETVRLERLLAKNSLELKETNQKKKSYPKGYRRSKEEIIKEKELKDERTLLIDSIDRLKSKYHKTSIQNMNVSIPFTDGFGISLKKMPSSMIRLPFMKGLMAYCPRKAFRDWCSEHNYTIGRITDIYGKSYSFSEIDYIFTKSQFKMWKYYNNTTDNQGNIIKTGWEVYKENFKTYQCDACICNVEEHIKLNGKTNYQVLQTLTTEMSDEDIQDLARYDIDCLNGIGRDIPSMLHILGADENKNNHMNWLQKSLVLYPEMLKDFYIKTLLKNTKDSMIKKFRSGKFNINGAYTFAIPDVLACMQWWFTDMDKCRIEDFGFVKEGHITCNLFDDDEELDCLRSPHLDHAHCIRNNYRNNKTKKWAKSSGVYISMKDTMSKLLMYDNDGDKLLVHNNKTIIKCAKSFQKKYGMIPNYYHMPKATPAQITNSSLFEGIAMAYHHGNIGTPSNEITKIWATLHPGSKEDEIKKAMEMIALRCADVNFTIDYAKTLYKPEVPKNIMSLYKEYSGKKVPHFFVYAKNKKEYQVEAKSKCNIDRISDVVKSNRIVFKDLLGTYSYKVLMHQPHVDIKDERAKKVIDLYRELESTNIRKLSHLDFSTLDTDEKKRAMLQIEFNVKKQKAMFLDIIGEPVEYIVDVLVKSLQNDINKDTLWKLFGDVIYKNIALKLGSSKICNSCKVRYLPKEKDYTSNYCELCTKEKKREQTKKRVQNYRKQIQNS